MKKAVILIIILGALGAAVLWRVTQKDETAAAAPKKAAMAPAGVDVMIAMQKTLDNNFSVKGSILPNEDVEIRAEVAGKITKINFREGQPVTKGQLLVAINDDELSASLRKLELNLALSKDNEARQKLLLDRGGISRQEYDNALYDYNSLKEEITRTKAMMDKTRIIAPMSGIIGLREVSPGSYVSAGTKITDLVSVDPVKIEFAVPETYSAKVKPGQDVSFTMAGSDKKHTAKVYAADAKIDEATRTMRIRATAPNPKRELLPGSFVNVGLKIEENYSAVVVPTQAVFPVLKGQRVYVIRGGKAVETAVQTGLRDSKYIEILSGVVPGDTIAVNGIIQVKNNMPVKIKKVIG